MVLATGSNGCLVERTDLLPIFGQEGDVKRLRDIEPPELRLRLGDYRIGFYDHGDWIEILRVRNRKEAYR